MMRASHLPYGLFLTIPSPFGRRLLMFFTFFHAQQYHKDFYISSGNRKSYRKVINSPRCFFFVSRIKKFAIPNLFLPFDCVVKRNAPVDSPDFLDAGVTKSARFRPDRVFQVSEDISSPCSLTFRSAPRSHGRTDSRCVSCGLHNKAGRHRAEFHRPRDPYTARCSAL